MTREREVSRVDSRNGPELILSNDATEAKPVRTRLSGAEHASLESLDLPGPSVVTVGSFDGVHRGHQHLIDTVVTRARERGWTSCVVTFEPHPRTVLRPDVPLCVLTTLGERIDLIQQLGVDVVAVVRFTPEVAQTSAEDFVRTLVSHLHMAELLVGPDFALGRGRQGTIPVLEDLGKHHGFTVRVVSAVHDDADEVVSSSRIRRCLSEGNVTAAAMMLGRPVSIAGTVVHGTGRGRQLGIPTANLAVPPTRCLPADGIYATYVTRPGHGQFAAATYVGTRPMFDGGARVVEVHLLDFDGDLYDDRLRVEFVDRIRGDERFPSLEAFLAQVRDDIEQVRRVLTERSSLGSAS